MPISKKFAQVAISGPMRKTFTYSVPENIGTLQQGQRVVVPFGRSSKTGFFIQYTSRPKEFETKPIKRILDETSFFPCDLFNLCLWIADYYFANPADCLISALPPKLKKNEHTDYYWGADCSLMPEKFKKTVQEGKKVPKNILKELVGNQRMFRQLIESKQIIEEHNFFTADTTQRFIGYRAGDEIRWSDFFKNRKNKCEFFDNVKTKSDLLEQGWSYYLIKKAVESEILVSVYSDSFGDVLDFIKPRGDVATINLTDEQKKVTTQVVKALSNGFKPFLLHGITGSGKTIVYCHIAEKVLENNKSVLVLTPEIALTGPTLSYFRGFFGEKVTVIHSSMTEKERLETWEGIRKGKFNIIIGPRSALFAPIYNLGLIIVDEEHDSSYKQQDPSPRFHGRDVAVMRAKFNNIPVLLGSATPSLESYQNAVDKKYELLTLNKRPGESVLPDVKVVDMKTNRINGDFNYLSYTLKKEIDERFMRKEQVILYLNRRGFSRELFCERCGNIPECPHCKINLTYHKVGQKLSCHYCGHIQTHIDLCTHCKSPGISFKGTGTQRVEDSLPSLFSDALILRLDSDTAFGRKNAYDILNRFANDEGNLLLGTQMVTKGLDLPNVTLVGVLSADLNMSMPGFRTPEKVFAQLIQVAGRSGRAGKKGKVIIQTYNPDNPVIDDAARQDYLSFFEREIESRKALNYPPFSHITNFIFSSKNEKQLETISKTFAVDLKKQLSKTSLTVEILGPSECPLYTLRGLFRRHLFIKTNQITKLINFLTEWEKTKPKFSLPSTIKITIDVDPYDMM